MNKRIFTNLLSKRPCIFEVGGADGADTLEFLSLFPNASMHVFEPDPENISILEKCLPASVRLNKSAVSDTNQVCLFHRSLNKGASALRLSGSIKKPMLVTEVWPTIEFEEKILVDSTNIDSYCEENNISKIDLIWADIQGAEASLIKGAMKMLPNIKAIFVEHSQLELYQGQPSIEEMLDLLGHAYDLIGALIKGQLLITNKVELGTREHSLYLDIDLRRLPRELITDVLFLNKQYQ